jgi:hydroxyethylthiazole kinase
LSAADFVELQAHISALCFNAPGLSAAEWHWPPLGFFIHFRRCGWLSERELIRCIPATYQTEIGVRGTRRVLENISDELARERISGRGAAILMRICRKYDIDRPQRLAHFLAQIYRETNVLLWTEELASGAEYEGNRDLGNVRQGDGIRFKGRGLMQTTGRYNYEAYSEYRGRSGTNSFALEPHNLALVNDDYTCADTAGLYWVSHPIGAHSNISRFADAGVDEAHLREVTRSVNGAADGRRTALVTRRSHLTVLSSALLESLSDIAPAVERKNV